MWLPVDISNVVGMTAPVILRETWRKSFAAEKNAVLYRFRCRFAYKNAGCGTTLNILVTDFHELFYKISDGGFFNSQGFIFDSDHDSCWQSMNFLFKIYMDYTAKLDPPKPADVKVTTYFMGEPDICRVKIHRKESDIYTERKSVEFLPF